MNRLSSPFLISLCLTIPSFPSLAQAADAGRWCALGSVTQSQYRDADGRYGREANSLSATCDGYAGSGALSDSSRVLTLAIDLFPAPNGSLRRAKTVELKFDDLRAGAVADYVGGDQDGLKSKVVAALAKLNPPVTGSDRFNLISAEVERGAVLRRFDKSVMIPKDAAPQKPDAVSAGLKVDGTRFGAEISCIAQMEKLPSSGISTAVRASDDSTAAAVIVGRNDGTGNYDLVVVPEGMFLNTYKRDLSGVESEHLVEIPASAQFKRPVAYYHALSQTSASSVFFDQPPYKNYRPQVLTLKPANLITDKTSPAHQLLLSAILDYTRSYRGAFDRDPRYRSQENLTLVRNALDACAAVPGLTDANSGELGFFAEHVLGGHSGALSQPGAVSPPAGNSATSFK